jgi:hypothetical protein
MMYYAGNTALSWLTSQATYMLRVDLWDWEGETKWAKYGSFYVGPKSDGYRLAVTDFSGITDVGEYKLCISVERYHKTFNPNVELIIF